MKYKLEYLKKQLVPGHVYRRSDLAPFTTSIDRHLAELVNDKTLKKLRTGLYFVPEKTVFGTPPPKDNELVRSFLKDSHFLLTSPNAYNSLGLGITQLYNKTVVYNHKRHGTFNLGGRTFEFKMQHRFPSKMTREFLLVDCLNNIDTLAEDTKMVWSNAKKQALKMSKRNLKYQADNYGSVRVKKFFEKILND